MSQNKYTEQQVKADVNELIPVITRALNADNEVTISPKRDGLKFTSSSLKTLSKPSSKRG